MIRFTGSSLRISAFSVLVPLSFLGSACSGESCVALRTCLESEAEADGDLGGAPGVSRSKEEQAGGAPAKDDKPIEEEPLCDPVAPDLPDSAYFDANCDGIDGDKSQAVFVAPSGDDAADGSLETPLATLRAGVQKARESQKDLYLCSAVYSEALLLEDTGVNIYGGYQCNDNWQRDESKATLAPASGVALTVRRVEGLRLEQILFRSVNSELASGSSIAGLLSDSKNVTLSQVELGAGLGGNGQAGADGAAFTAAASDGKPGTAANCGGCIGPAGGTGAVATACGFGQGNTPLGGAGGRGSHSGGTSTSGSPGGDWSVVPGGARSSSVSIRAGSSGSPGGVTAPGLVSELALGVFDGEHYLPLNSGASGVFGQRGLSGGGGAGGEIWTNAQGNYSLSGDSGGQGGSGGCGGRPGTGGSAGGGSFALVVMRSELLVLSSTFAPLGGGAGGNAGRGSAGQLGGKGGLGGAGTTGGATTQGGKGGDGGNGGAGSSGAPGGGGPTISIALIDSPLPEVVSSSFVPGPGGPGGLYTDGRHGPTGVQADAFDFTSGEPLSF